MGRFARITLLVAMAATLLGSFATAAVRGSGPALRFDQALFTLSPSTTPPDDAASWSPVTLTDLWRESRPDAEGRGWYRFSFELDAPPDERWAVYLPGLASNAEVFVNGEYVGSGGRMEPPVTLNSNRPLFFAVSPRTLHAGLNRVDVALFAYRDSFDRLEPIQVGPASMLEPRFERQEFWDVDMARFATGLILAMGLFIGAIWLGSRRDAVYGWFLAASALWAIVTLNYHIRDLPLAFHDWERLVHFSLLGAAASGLMLAIRLVDASHPRIERGVLAGVLVAAVAIALTPVGSLQSVVQVLHGVSMLLLLSIVVIIGRRRRLLQHAELPIMLTGATAFFAIAAHDFVIQYDVLPMDAPRLMPMGGPLILFMFASCLTARFMRASRRVAQLNVELEDRVSESEQELAASYGRMAGLEKDRALADERARILREVHDGMGGKIVSSLALLETGRAPEGRIAHTLRESLDDMRLLMHSLHPDMGDLDALLGMLRDRLESRLQGTGIAIVWRPGDLPVDVPLSPEQSHNVGRIVEEAFTNVLKHAQASRVRVSTEIARRDDRDHVLLRVRDDGRSRSMPAAAGQGIDNMRNRAEASGGQLEVEHTGDGTEVRLWLPLTGDTTGRTDASHT